jgi:hypothetical protein
MIAPDVPAPPSLPDAAEALAPLPRRGADELPSLLHQGPPTFDRITPVVRPRHRIARPPEAVALRRGRLGQSGQT